MFAVLKQLAVAVAVCWPALAWCSEPDAAERRGEHTVAVRLLVDGASTHRIVVEPSASASEKHAAAELQSHFQACTGVTLPIVEGTPEDGSPMIVLGCGTIAAGLGVRPTDDELGPQGCVLRTVGPHLVIAGTPAAGTLYGVRRFLEQHLGVRWYAPGVTKTPHTADLVLGKLDRLVKPAFLWRRTTYAWPGGDEEFRCRRGENSGSGGKDHVQGLQYAFDGTCHTYFRFISPDEFFDTHPEYFSEIGGRRTRTETQLCLSNPEVLEIVTRRMLMRMKDMPHCRQHNFSQMDWYNGCRCADCRAINRRYGTDGGTQFWFVNQLAERTSKVFPEKLIGTLAYTYTEQPPEGMAMHPNVAVWLCHMFPSCDSHPIESCPHNADYKRRALAWSKLCSHLYVWHYIVDFAHYYNPFPNFRALAADMRFYRKIGVEGIYGQGMGSGGGGGEFSLLRPYYVTELMKDPDQDADAVLRDFLDGYYGRAAGPIWQYIALLHEKVDREQIHMHLYTNPARGYLTDDVMDESARLFDQAEAAVGRDPELLERVRVARMPLVYARLFPRNGYQIGEGLLTFRPPLATPLEAAAMVRRMGRHGFRAIREWHGDPGQLPMLSAMLNLPVPVVTLRNEHLEADIVPLLGGRVLRITDRKTGQCVTAWNATRNLMFPFCGGENSCVANVYLQHLGGAMDPAVPKQRDQRSVRLERTTGNGFTMVRQITLDADRPVLTIAVTVTNPTDKPREAQLRSQLALELGDLRATRVRMTPRSGNPGEKTEKDLSAVIAGLREGEPLYDQDCPRGGWAFTGSKGLRVEQRFDDRRVDSAWLHAYPEELNELNVELWAKKVILKPGESTTLEHELEVDAAER